MELNKFLKILEDIWIMIVMVKSLVMVILQGGEGEELLYNQ